MEENNIIRNEIIMTVDTWIDLCMWSFPEMVADIDVRENLWKEVYEVFKDNYLGWKENPEIGELSLVLTNEINQVIQKNGGITILKDNEYVDNYHNLVVFLENDINDNSLSEFFSRYSPNQKYYIWIGIDYWEIVPVEEVEKEGEMLGPEDGMPNPLTWLPKENLGGWSKLSALLSQEFQKVTTKDNKEIICLYTPIWENEKPKVVLSPVDSCDLSYIPEEDIVKVISVDELF